MRGFILGFLLCLSGSAVAYALDVQIQTVSVRDIFAGSALAGLLSTNGNLPPNVAAELSWQYANALMRKR